MTERFVPQDEIGSLLRLVRGVQHVVVDTNHDGELQGIQIEIAPDEPPRRIVRDVESALMSGLGLTVDHRMIRVRLHGQRRNSVATGPNGSIPAQNLQQKAGAVPPANPMDRIRLRSVRTDPDGELYCRVTVEIEADGERYDAEVREADTGHARILAAGRATIAALSRSIEREVAIALEGIEEFMICDEPAMIARIQARRGLDTRAFQGAALTEGQPHHAAARAVLDALNRYWAAEEHGN